MIITNSFLYILHNLYLHSDFTKVKSTLGYTDVSSCGPVKFATDLNAISKRARLVRRPPKNTAYMQKEILSHTCM